MKVLFLLFLSFGIFQKIKGSCSVEITPAIRLESTWQDNGNTYTIYDINIYNSGSETIETLYAEFENEDNIEQTWNFNSSTGEIFNFYQIPPLSTWTGVGMIVVGTEAPVIRTTTPRCISPTSTPTSAATESPSSSSCKVLIQTSYNLRFPFYGYYVNITNVGTEVVTSVVATFRNVTSGFNYNASTGQFTSIHNLFPGQYNNLTTIVFALNPGPSDQPPPASVFPLEVTPQCRPLVVPECEPVTPTPSKSCEAVVSFELSGAQYITPEDNNTNQDYTIIVRNNGSSLLTGANLYSYKSDPFVFPVEMKVKSGLERFLSDPTGGCTSDACIAAYLGQYVALIPDSLCPGEEFSATVTLSGDPVTVGTPFVFYVTKSFCY